jgi:hypothetical protein
MVFLVEQDENPSLPALGRDLSLEEWWCNFVSGIMMPKFLPAVKSAARLLSRG